MIHHDAYLLLFAKQRHVAKSLQITNRMEMQITLKYQKLANYIMPIPKFMNIRRWRRGEAETADKAAGITDSRVSAVEAAARKEKLELAKARRIAEQEAKRVRLTDKKAKMEREKPVRAEKHMEDEIWKDEITRQVIFMRRGSKSDMLARISRECGVRPAKAFRRISRLGMLNMFLESEEYHAKTQNHNGTEEAHSVSARKPVISTEQSDGCAELAALAASNRTIKAKELLKALKKTGFITMRDGEGSHIIAKNELNGRISVISVHNPGSELDRGIIKETLQQLGINLSKGQADSNAAE